MRSTKCLKGYLGFDAQIIYYEVAIGPVTGRGSQDYWSGNNDIHGYTEGGRTSMLKRATFVVGECFGSYQELDQRVKTYQKEKFVQLTHRDSRAFEDARKRVPKRVEGAKNGLTVFMILPAFLAERNT